MITNPYKVLEVSPNASNDEIKKAYRELSRKYHPDSYVNNPLSELAEEKFKEVQEAYDQIMKERESGNNGGSYNQSFYDAGSGDEPIEMTAVRNYLNSGHYTEALRALSDIQLRNGKWYFYSAVGNAGIGNNILAVEHARQAVVMEPNNQEYRNFLNRLEWQSQRYQYNRNTGNGYGGYGRNYGTGNFCCDLWCADTLCECMGGDLCSCF